MQNNENNTGSILGGIVASVCVLMIFIFAMFQFYQPATKSFGSVQYGGEYQSTTTVAAMKFTAGGAGVAPLVLKAGPGTLGSITIASTTAQGATGVFKIYDGTYSTSTATSTLASFQANASMGTYTFDANFYAGLIIDAPVGFNGLYTVTFR